MKNLIIHMPVIHKGYLDFLDSLKGKIDTIYLIGEKLVEELSSYNPDISALKPKQVKYFLEALGYKNIKILEKYLLSYNQN